MKRFLMLLGALLCGAALAQEAPPPAPPAPAASEPAAPLSATARRLFEGNVIIREPREPT